MSVRGVDRIALACTYIPCTSKKLRGFRRSPLSGFNYTSTSLSILRLRDSYCYCVTSLRTWWSVIDVASNDRTYISLRRSFAEVGTMFYPGQAPRRLFPRRSGCTPTRFDKPPPYTCTCSRSRVRICRLQIYILLYYTKHDERKGSRNAGGGRLVSLFKLPFLRGPPITTSDWPVANHSSLSRSRILCVSLDLTKCLATEVKTM